MVSRIAVEWPPYLSYDKSRGDVDKFYDGTNGAIKSRDSIFYNRRLIDIFLLALAVGKQIKSRRKLKKPSITLSRDALTPTEIWMMCSVVLADSEADLETVADPKTIVRVCEEYANGGIDIVMNADNRSHTEFYERMLEEYLR